MFKPTDQSLARAVGETTAGEHPGCTALPVRGRGEWKDSQFCKSMIKLLGPEDVWHPKRGAPRGNRNALKTGLHTAALRDLRQRIAAWRRQVRAVLAALEEPEKDTPSAPAEQRDREPVWRESPEH